MSILAQFSNAILYDRGLTLINQLYFIFIYIYTYDSVTQFSQTGCTNATYIT